MWGRESPHKVYNDIRRTTPWGNHPTWKESSHPISLPYCVLSSFNKFARRHVHIYCMQKSNGSAHGTSLMVFVYSSILEYAVYLWHVAGTARDERNFGITCERNRIPPIRGSLVELKSFCFDVEKFQNNTCTCAYVTVLVKSDLQKTQYTITIEPSRVVVAVIIVAIDVVVVVVVSMCCWSVEWLGARSWQMDLKIKQQKHTHAPLWGAALDHAFNNVHCTWL